MPAPKVYSARRIAALVRSGLADKEVAAAVGCSRTRAGQTRRACGLPPNKVPFVKWSDAEWSALVRLLDAGLTEGQAARKLGRTPQSVRHQVSRRGFAGLAKYHDNSTRLSAAFDLFAAGYTPRMVADSLGVHIITAYKYKRLMPADWLIDNRPYVTPKTNGRGDRAGGYNKTPKGES